MDDASRLASAHQLIGAVLTPTSSLCSQAQRKLTQVDGQVRVPRIMWEATGRRVLTMEWIDGVKLTDRPRMAAKGLRVVDFVDVGIECTLRQLLDKGYFHAGKRARLALQRVRFRSSCIVQLFPRRSAYAAKIYRDVCCTALRCAGGETGICCNRSAAICFALRGLMRRRACKSVVSADRSSPSQCSPEPRQHCTRPHADPHPGNLLATSAGDLVYLDFGMMSEAPQEARYAIIQHVVHLVNRDYEVRRGVKCLPDFKRSLFLAHKTKSGSSPASTG